MAKPKTDRLFLQSLARGLKVLESFTPERPRITLTELAEVTGLSLAAVQRCTHTLVSLGYLHRGEHKEFSLGPKVLSLGYSSLQGSELRRLAESQLKRLSRRLGCTVNLAVLDGPDVLILYRHEVQRFFKFDVQPGTKLPCHCTAMGKVLLAALEDTALKQILAGVKLQRLTPHTITRREQLLRELKEVRRRGMAESDREATPALYSLAVPLLNHEERVVAAINVSVLKAEESSSLPRGLMSSLVAEGRKLSEFLGYQGDYPRITVGPPRLGGI